MNFNNVLAEARKKATESGSGQGRNYLNIGKGTNDFRLLYNPKSDKITRDIHRHWSEELKAFVPCLKEMYGEDCPMCKIREDWKANTGKEPDWTLNPQTKTLAFVHYISSTEKRDKIKEGDIVLMVAPKSVGKEINKIVAEFADNIDDILGKNTACRFKVTQQQGVMVEYSVLLDNFKKVSTATDEEAFKKVLEELDNLDEVFYPASGATPELRAQVEDAATKRRTALGWDKPEDTPPAK